MSAISYKLLKILFNKDKEFMHKMFNDIMNNKVNTDFIAQMIVVPIFKKNKKKATQDKVESFRQICLGDTCLKIVEGC